MTPTTLPPLEPGRTPDIEFAERSVLGSIIESRAAAETVLGILRSDDCFASAHHRAVCAAVRYLIEENQPADMPSVLARLVAAEAGVWRTGQAGVILADLIRHASPSYEAHARTVLKAAVRRRGLLALDQAGQMLADPGADPEASADQVRKLIDDALATGTPASPLPTQAEIVDQVLAGLEAEAEPGLSTGYRDLDEAITGMFAGELIIVGARPGIGKSVVGYGFASHAGMRLGLPVLFMSLEMSREQLTQRLIAAQARVSLTRLRKHTLSEDDWLRIRNAHDRMTSSRVLIDDTPHASLAHIRSRLRGMARTDPARLLVVDYLGLLAEPKGAENRQTAVSALSRGLKLIAREHGIPVVALAQLNRNPEARHDKRPQLADLRESGAQEQDADVVLLLHREDAYERESPRAGEIDVIVAKQRQGPQCMVTLAFQGAYARCTDMSGVDPPAGADYGSGAFR